MIHRVTELIKDIGLDSKWKLDEVMVSAIAFILKKWKLLYQNIIKILLYQLQKCRYTYALLELYSLKELCVER
jgi:hypothetical protein